HDTVPEACITQEAGPQQMSTYAADVTSEFTPDLTPANPDMKGMFDQTAGPPLGALQAIKAARLTGEVLVAGFDGVPEFVPLLQSGELVVSGMQQPYLMGQESGRAMVDHLSGKTAEKEILVPIKIVTSSNIEEELPIIKETVFANEM